ncbi:unnamed protein product [Sphagnum tenellum]
MRDRGCWTMIMISVADTQLPTTKSNEMAKDCVKWASNLATGGPTAAEILIDTRSGVQSAQAGRQARLYWEQTSRHPVVVVVSALPVPVPTAPVPAVYVMTFGVILKV